MLWSGKRTLGKSVQSRVPARLQRRLRATINLSFTLDDSLAEQTTHLILAQTMEMIHSAAHAARTFPVTALYDCYFV